VLNYWKIKNGGDSQYAINSIRLSTNHSEQATPMMSVFYDVIRLESVCGRSNVPIEGHF